MVDISIWAALAGGLIILALAGDFLITAALAMAHRFGVSPLTSGILIVGFGTSAPELFVSLAAALDQSPGLAFGNLVGSNIANSWLVLAIPAIFLPIQTQILGLRTAFGVLALSTLIFIALTIAIPLTAPLGAAFLVFLAAYFLWFLRRSHRAVINGQDASLDVRPDLEVGFAQIGVRLVLGIIGLPLGAYLVVEGGVAFARHLDVSEAVIGLTLLAIGTSLPELAAVIAAALRRQAGLLVGNVIGSNMFNLLGAGGIIALFGPLTVPQGFLAYDYWVLAAATLSLALFILPRERISRLAALALILVYMVYLYGLISGWNITAGILGA